MDKEQPIGRACQELREQLVSRGDGFCQQISNLMFNAREEDLTDATAF